MTVRTNAPPDRGPAGGDGETMQGEQAASGKHTSGPRPSCRPGCALAMPTASWTHLLDDDPGRAPPAWRLAWALHGLPRPLPMSEYRNAFAALESAYGAEVVLDGLRKARAIPPAHGSGVDTRRLDALVDAWQARTREVAA